MKKREFLRTAAWLPVALAGLPLSSAPSSAQALRVVKIGTVGGTSDAGLWIADELGYFKEVGIQLEIVRFTSGAAMLTALVTQQIDGGGITFTPGLFSAIQQGLKIQIVGDKQSFAPKFSPIGLVVRSDLVKDGASREENFAVLKGKKFGITSKATQGMLTLLNTLAKYGISESDIQIVELSFPNMVTGIASGAIDAAPILEPFLTKALKMGVGKEISDTMEGRDGLTAGAPLVFGEKFAADTKLATDFMIGYMRGVRVYNDAFRKSINKQMVIDIMAKKSGLDVETITEIRPAALDPNQRFDKDEIDKYQKFFFDRGLLRTQIDTNGLVNTKFADAAVQALGEYKN